ncbi:MAG: LysM peptidoglycan-binding domain-containing protein [Anaerolineae bacterium]|nr:LysM peptidoglycan-binding domain-containing protein [Anaerolineae bacterium]
MGITRRFSWRRSISSLLVVALVVGFLVAFVPAQPAQASGYCTQYHTVKYGENLFRIGLQYGVSWTYLKAINGLYNANWIYAGQTLCVSTGGYSPPQYPQYPQYPSYCAKPYVVRYGDTLGKIAAWYGYNVYYLAQFNGLYNANWIYAGQTICLP